MQTSDGFVTYGHESWHRARRYSIDRFLYDADTKSFSAYASDLTIPIGTILHQFFVEGSRESVEFEYHTTTHDSFGDVAWWWYRGTDSNGTSYNLKIWND